MARNLVYFAQKYHAQHVYIALKHDSDFYTRFETKCVDEFPDFFEFGGGSHWMKMRILKAALDENITVDKLYEDSDW